MGGARRILIVDDEPQAVGLLRTILESENFDVEQACDSDELRGALAHQTFDLITLDLGMPGYSGVELARELSQVTDTPFIVISGRSAEFDRVLALEIGADDYIVKPFSTRELAARVRAVLRRADGGRRLNLAAQQSEIRFHGYTLNTQSRKLRNPQGGLAALTVAECRLLEMLVQNCGRACTRDEMTSRIKGHAWSPMDRSLDTLVARLRRKIEPHPDRPALLMSVRGVGYMMTTSP
jgi:DNA-binding response OmpR family regulator